MALSCGAAGLLIRPVSVWFSMMIRKTWSYCGNVAALAGLPGIANSVAAMVTRPVTACRRARFIWPPGEIEWAKERLRKGRSALAAARQMLGTSAAEGTPTQHE